MSKIAKLEAQLIGDFDEILKDITNEILTKNMSSNLEDASDFVVREARCSVRVFERYSMIGSNRVSLNVTLFEANGLIQLSAITSGGSQAILFKMNTFGEEAFLEEIRPVIENYQVY